MLFLFCLTCTVLNIRVSSPQSGDGMARFDEMEAMAARASHHYVSIGLGAELTDQRCS